MTCQDLDYVLLDASPASPLPLEAVDHLKRCTACRNVVEALSVPIPDGKPAPGILRQIEATIAMGMRTVKPIAPPFSLAVTLVAGLLAVVGWGIAGHRALALRTMTRFQGSAILAALIAGAALVSWSLIGQIIPGSPCRIPRKPLPISTLVCLTIAVALLFPFASEKDFWRTSWTCIRNGICIAALTTIPLWLVLRRGAILSRPLAGATAGLLAGLAGTIVLETNCPNVEGWHILTAHLGVSALAAITGFAIGIVADIQFD